MASIYDSYQIAQSQQTRPYLGNNISELRELGNEMQRRYDTTVATMDNIDMLARQVSTDPKSEGALKETLQGVRARLQEYAARPDKENLIRPTSILARDFVSDAQTFMGNQKAIQGYLEEIDKMEGVDRNTKERTKRIAQMEYQGLRRDPETGRLVNPFRGSYTPPKSIDALTFVNKVGDGIKADAGGSNVRNIQGDYYVEVGGEWKKVSPERVAAITQNLIQSDPEMQAYLDYQGMLSGKEALYNEKVRSIEDVPSEDIEVTLPDGKKSKVNLRQRVQEFMDKNGVDAPTAVATMRATNRKREIVNQLTEAAIGKFAFKEQSSTRKIMGETEAAGRAAQEPLRFMVTAPSNVATGELANMSAGDLRERIQATDQSIAAAKQKVAQLLLNGAAPSDIQTAQNQLRSLQDQKMAGESVLNNTNEEAARQLGYQNYADYINRNVAGKVRDLVNTMPTDMSGNLTGLGAQMYDRNGNPVTGRGISRTELASALQSGQMRRVDPGADMGIPGQAYYEVPTANGTIRIPDRGGDSEINLLRYNVDNEVKGDFNKKVKELFKDSKNLAYNTQQINLVKGKETEDLERLYAGDPNAFTVYDRAGKPILDQDDLPKDLTITSMDVVKGGNGSVRLRGYVENKDKKGNVEDREYFTIVPNPNNNVGSVLGARILKDARKMTSPVDQQELAKVGFEMMGDDWTGKLNEAAVNENIPIKNAFNETLGYIRKERNEANPQQKVYRLYNAAGERVNTMGANRMMTDVYRTDAVDAANLVRSIIQNANQKQAQSQSQ